MNKLSVYWGEELVGTLTRHTRGRVKFQYSDSWLSGICRPISLSLPCQAKSYPPGVSTAFLDHFGEDCAGALSILSEDKVPDLRRGQYKDVTGQLVKVLNKVKSSPANHQLFSAMDNVRLSIAGAQDKLPVYFDSGKFYLPLSSGSATTHIIKT